MLLATVGSDAYKWLLAFHILLAVVWVGSSTAIQIFVIRADRAGGDRLAYFASEIEWYGTRVLLPSSLTLVVLGFILLHESSGAYDLGQGWVTFGFVVWLFSFIVGAGYLGPESGRLGKMVEEHDQQLDGVLASQPFDQAGRRPVRVDEPVAAKDEDRQRELVEK